MRIDSLGEFGLIARIKRLIKKPSRSVIVGSGDDCAVLAFDKSRYQLFTCDMLVEGVDFKRTDDPYLIGRKALAVTLSDIAACAGVPQYFLVSIALPKYTKLSFVDRLSRGMLDLARRYKVDLVGGDVSSGEKLTIDISMLGAVEKKYLLLRSGAKKGDIVFVSGSLGGTITGKHFSFTPRIKEARSLARKYKVHAMIDISDGLLQDMRHILDTSKVGAILYEELIPVAKAAPSRRDALYAGEDFELLFSLPLKEARRLIEQKKKAFFPIGEIVDKNQGLKVIDIRGREVRLKTEGFTHF